MISRRNTQDTSFRDYSWSNRFLTLAIGGILFLTMYPFQLSHAKPCRYGVPFFLGSSGKAGGPLDIFLNVLLFMPYGFGIGTKLLRRGTSRTATLICTTLAGALFSYAIEFTQLYVPFRDSGWQDVLTNTTGAFLGCCVAFLLGSWIFHHLSNVQGNVQRWITPRRLASLLVIYLGTWFIVSAFLTREISLQDWRNDCLLIFGNDAAGRRPWKGKVLQVQIWDHTFSKKAADRLTSGLSAPAMDDPLANLDFGDEQSSNGTNTARQTASRSVPIVASPALSNFVVNRIKRANQFSIRAVLLPRVGAETNGPILSLSQEAGFADLYIGERGDDVVFWFRSPVNVRRGSIEWEKIPNALNESRARTVIFSYDGSTLSSYIDGKNIQNRRLGVQTALASYVRHLKVNELNGYRYIYYALLFFPAGALIGIIATAPLWRLMHRSGVVVFWCVVPAVVLEWILADATRAPFSLGNIALAVTCTLVGLLWANTDGRPRVHLATGPPSV
ncbi:MAG: VanZ family protein [Candidatus Acidiferrales bacterium]